MPELTFDFTWYRDAKGYGLIAAKPITRRRGQSILDVRIDDIQPARVVRKGGALQSYRPLDKFPNLYEQFVGIQRTENGVKGFIERFGPLTNEGLRGNGEVVPAMIDRADAMAELLRGHTVAMPLNSLQASIVTKDNSIRLKVSPACLLDALWLQLVQAKASGKGARECLQCQTLFTTGVGTNRRADAKFCSDVCRIKYNSLRRSR
jgi:hypothetical protein